MTADEFSSELKTLAPSIEDLRKLDLSIEDAEEFRKRFSCHRLSNSLASDPLVDLCTNFDISTVTVGSITFCRIEEFDSLHWKIGEGEFNPIVIPKTGGLVSIRDHENLQREIAVCAINSGNFLAALLRAERFLAQCPFNPEKRTRGQERFISLDECAALAGGQQFRRFYRGLMGIEESLLSRIFSRH